MTESSGEWRIYKDPNIPDGQYLLGYKGCQHPMNEDQVVPAIKRWAEAGIEGLEKLKKNQETVPIDEMVKFLRTLLDLTTPETGFFYCPKNPLENLPIIEDLKEMEPQKGILTRYGKKLLKEGAEFYSRLTIKDFIDESNGKESP